MNTLLGRNPTPNIMTENEIVGYLRSNHTTAEEVLQYFNNLNSKFYLHFIDGDDWSKRTIWTQNKEEDKGFCLDMYNMVSYKDTLIKYADEFIIIDNKNYSEEIYSILSSKDYTVTTVVVEFDGKISTKYMDLKKIIYSEVKKNKDKNKGGTYGYNSKDLSIL